MLKINNIKFKKYRIPLLLFAISISGIFLYQYLTFIPEYSYAESISTPVYNGEDMSPTLSSLTYMDEMTPAICGASRMEETKRLIDRRDNKMYWVAKLPDDNCWMTQNLDYDGGGTASSPTAFTTEMPTRYHDPGLYIRLLSASTQQCGAVSSLGACAGWINVSGWTPYETTSDIQYDPDAKQYDAHYLAGNYYNWEAAVKSTGLYIGEKTDASDSICPTGWKLPSGRAAVDSMATKLGEALMSYGYDHNYQYPTYFVPVGMSDKDGIIGVNTMPYYWTSTKWTDGMIAQLSGNNKQVTNAFGVGYPEFGFPIRCVIEGVGEPVIPEVDNPTLSVSIPNIITLDVYSDPEDKDNNVVSIDTNTNDINTGEFIAEVSANTSYKITLNSTSEDSEGTSLIGKKDNGELNGYSIPTLNTNPDGTYTQPQKGTSSWGIRTCTSMLLSSCDTEQYKPLPEHNQTPDTINPFYTGTPGSNQSTLFQIGIGISPNLPSGTYSTQIQVTASSTGSN